MSRKTSHIEPGHHLARLTLEAMSSSTLMVKCRVDMSRVLTQLLGVDESAFRLRVWGLERFTGNPSSDIRLAVDVVRDTKQKIAELGLDPRDTTGRELYQVLQDKLRSDEATLRKTLGIADGASPAKIISGVQASLQSQVQHSQVFALKHTALRRVLKQLKPKATMKALGYRSQESMFKHEPAPQLLAAACIVESIAWHEQRVKAYGKLQARDFELRDIKFFAPSGKQWPKLAERYTGQLRQHMMVLSEMGAVVLLPPKRDMTGLVVTSLVLGNQAMNDIRANSTYLKLHQVQPDFAQTVQSLIMSEPLLSIKASNQELPWKFIHWFYAHNPRLALPLAFQPHVQKEDVQWHGVESALSAIDNSIAFWQDSASLGLVDAAGDVVSCNLLDVSIATCNGLTYADRLVRHMRTNLERELIGRYLQHNRFQAAIDESLGQQFVSEFAD